MQLILTNEQADFDALASLFAASLLEDALPVLPRRTNHNVRSFLTLYGQEFAFVDPRDLPQEPVVSVTLVDTQSMITLKGMGRETRVKVFDHHPARAAGKNAPERGLSADSNVVIFELGAATTYFAEILQERGTLLTPIQASLLLLGIYEDTGTLTYSHTTARDVYAVGWLLEQGADLALAGSFLNPPLSEEQRQVYDQLVAGIESIQINGHRVLVACAEALNISEEISTLAHKLRDLFDPDALFVLVKMKDGVRCVARSSTDEIDVSAIAAHFGGGGHNRAAAALIRPPAAEGEAALPLSEVREKLLKILPRFVKPAITVAQLMSKRARTISADTPVQEAASLMAKYGYEGFPVLQDGKVVGLLTRRVVDRAINHKLNLNAASLMEAGSVTVFASDSLQHLQTVMAESGWGQIPVIETETQKMVGIVTRTDLLKMLARRQAHNTPANSLTHKLQKSISASKLALIKAVAEEAASKHLPLFIVGGFVRDLLLDHPGSDLDMVVEGDAIALGKGLALKYGGKCISHARFGTAKWFLADSQFTQPGLPEFLDLISSRQEFYEHPSALPTIEQGSIKLDLHRRDFTINSMALRLDGRHFGELHDYYAGVSDLKRKLVRVLHSLSFVDDPTRILRAVRYEQRYKFQIEPRTLQLLDESLPLVKRLSPERLRHEIDQILVEAKVIPMLERLHALGLLNQIAPELPWTAEISARLKSALSSSADGAWGQSFASPSSQPRVTLLTSLWLLELTPSNIDALHERLCFPLVTLKVVRAAAQLYADLPRLRGGIPSQWVARLDGLPALAIYAVYLVTREPEFESYTTHWQHQHPHTTGDKLKARGLQPGPAYQSILTTLRNAWLDGEIGTEGEEIRMLEKLLGE